jgi:hypothetical protein
MFMLPDEKEEVEEEGPQHVWLVWLYRSVKDTTLKVRWLSWAAIRVSPWAPVEKPAPR